MASFLLPEAVELPTDSLLEDDLIAELDFDTLDPFDSFDSFDSLDLETMCIYNAAHALGSILHEALEYSTPESFKPMPFAYSSKEVLEEQELDEEITSLEEEIARIEEKKRALKTTSLPGSPTSSPSSSSSSGTSLKTPCSFEINLDFLSASPFRQFIPQSPEQTALAEQHSVHQSESESEEHVGSNSPAVVQHSSKKRPPKARKGSLGVNKDNRWTPSKKRTKTKKSRFSKKNNKATDPFRLEQILIINRVETEEEEEVDIL